MHRNRALAITACVIASLTCTILLFGVSPVAASTWTVPLHSASNALARAQGAPTTPTGVSAACVSPTTKQVRVTWTAVAHASSYTVYQSTTSATAGFALAGTIATSPWTSPTLAIGHTYWYEVAASIGTNWSGAQSSAPAGHAISSSGCA